MNNLKCCLCWKASVEFITENIKCLALKYLSFIFIYCKFVPSFPQDLLSTFYMLGMLVGFGDKTTNKTDMVTALMVFTVQEVGVLVGSTHVRNNYTPDHYKVYHML